MDKIDCLWTQGYKGGYIHHSSVNNVSKYTYQMGGVTRPAKSYRSAQVLITRAQ